MEEKVEQFAQFLSIKEIKDDNSSLTYLQLEVNEYGELELIPYTKQVSLTRDNICSIKDDFVKSILELTTKPPLKTMSRNTPIKDVLYMIESASNMIATNGRIGKGNVIITNYENYEKYELVDTKYKVFIDERINDIIVYRKNQLDQPGLVLIHNETKYEFVSIGFYPDRQFEKIEIVN